MYFFAIEIDLNGEKEITLPKDQDIVILSATETNSTLGGLVTPLCEEVKERKFNFKMTSKEKKQYKKERKKKNLHDKKFYNRKNWGKDY